MTATAAAELNRTYLRNTYRCTVPTHGAVGGPYCRILALGRYRDGEGMALVQFWKGYKATVPTRLLEKVTGDKYRTDGMHSRVHTGPAIILKVID